MKFCLSLRSSDVAAGAQVGAVQVLIPAPQLAAAPVSAEELSNQGLIATADGRSSPHERLETLDVLAKNDVHDAGNGV